MYDDARRILVICVCRLGKVRTQVKLVRQIVLPAIRDVSSCKRSRESEFPEEVVEEKRECIPETPKKSHSVTAGPRMYPSADGSFSENGLDTLTYAEYNENS